MDTTRFDPAEILFREVASKRPDLYAEILDMIRPHSLRAVVRLLSRHLQGMDDLAVFEKNRKRVPLFAYKFVRLIRPKFPSPGDGLGIKLTCRVTKADTQETLDSKHLQSVYDTMKASFNVEPIIKNEIELFSNQCQVVELANRKKYACVYLKDYTVQELLLRLPNACELERGGQYNKGKDARGESRYLSVFRYLLVEDRGVVKVLYQRAQDLHVLLRHVDNDRVWAFTDIRYLFDKCGIVCHFFNMIRLVQTQLFQGEEEESPHQRDLLTIMKIQCRTGIPLPMTRDGLAKHKERTPMEVLSFEAFKKNFIRLATSSREEYDVKSSADKIFFGQQFNEGTGYDFAILPKTTAGPVKRQRESTGEGLAKRHKSSAEGPVKRQHESTDEGLAKRHKSSADDEPSDH